MRRPTGVTAIAVVFFLIAAYLGGIGVVVLVSPGTVSMTGPPAARIRTGRPVRGSASRRGLGADWLGITPPLRLGPLGGDARDHIGSRDVGSPLRTERLSFRSSLVWEGLEVFMRVAVVWYLFRTPVAEQFSKSARAT